MIHRICIVGAGAIGGLFAAYLATLQDTEVWAFDLSAEHVDAINAGGLRLTGHVELVAPVHARTDPAQIPPCELGIVATKGTVTRPAIAAAAPIFAARGAVCSMQNGIGNEEVIAADVPRVIRGVTLPAARVDGPGVIHMVGPGLTWIGPFEPAPAPAVDIELLAELLNRSGLETRALADARGAQWTKLLFNAATNPVCALTGLTHGQMVDHPPSRRLAGELLREGQAVAGALGIVLDSDPVALVDEAGQANYLHRPSMLQDVAARRPTEIATLNGGIVDAARRVGVAVPHHEAIVDLIRGLEHSWTV
jgi:2-dehydropantoate 2-reductase